MLAKESKISQRSDIQFLDKMSDMSDIILFFDQLFMNWLLEIVFLCLSIIECCLNIFQMINIIFDKSVSLSKELKGF